MMDNKELWSYVLTEVELAYSKANFTTWFKETFILKQDDGTIYIAVPSEFVRNWLHDKFHKFILKSLRTKAEYVRAVEYIIAKDDGKKKDEPVRHVVQNSNSALPLQDFYINKDDNLNPRYTFDTFVVGPFNELAYAASQAIVKNPGVVYNPLFIYGSTGHGKTHLIQAIGNHVKASRPGKRIYYVTSEKFAMDYITSVQANKVNYFKEKYRKYDMLIMDDIQFFSNTEKTQEELFHLFNNFYDDNKQIIFSSDKHPNYIPNLHDRLKSRFGQGMLLDIPEPDRESRVLIIKAKAAQSKFMLENDVVDFLANTLDNNIREIEGAINTIVCNSQLKGKMLTLPEVKNLVKNSGKPKKMVSVKDVIKTIANFYNIEEDSIYDKTRRKEVVKPRQLIMYILREDFDVSYPSIGEKLGGRDHTTVIHSCEKIKNDLKDNSVLVEELRQIRSLI